MQQGANYVQASNIDPDVFFMGSDGPISPSQREEWIEDHKKVTNHSDIDYDNKTGTYNFSLRVPDKLATNYLDNKTRAKKIYSKYSHVNLSFASSGVYLTGTVQSPCEMCFLMRMIEYEP